MVTVTQTQSQQAIIAVCSLVKLGWLNLPGLFNSNRKKGKIAKYHFS